MVVGHLAMLTLGLSHSVLISMRIKLAPLEAH